MSKDFQNHPSESTTIPTVFTHNPAYDSRSQLPQQQPIEIEEYVSLRSAEGHEFIAPFEWLSCSQTIYNMIHGPGKFQEAKSVIHIPSKAPHSIGPIRSPEGN